MKLRTKLEEKPKRGRPSKQKSVYNEKKTKQKEIKSIVDDIVVLDNLTIENNIIEFEELSEQKETINLLSPNFLDINVLNLPEHRFFREKTEKTQIVIHHTSSGGGIRDDIKEYLNSEDRNTTHYIIERTGEITQFIDTDYWCNHLGIKKFQLVKYGLDENKNTELNKSSISIELDSWGDLDKIGEKKYKTNNGVYIYLDEDKVVGYKNGFNKTKMFYEIGFKGKLYYEKYTSEQIEALGKLLNYLGKKHNISLTYKGDKIFNINMDALNGDSGIWTHVSYKDDVRNCHPDSELINKLKTL